MAEYAAATTLLQSGDAATPVNYTTIFKVTSVTGPELSNPTIDVTGLEDTVAEFTSSLVADGGNVTFGLIFDPSTSAIHDTLLDRCQAGSADNYRLCWSDIAGNTIAFAVGDVNTATEVITEVGHGLHTGQPIRFTTAGTLPAPLAAGTTYYCIDVAGDSYKVATTNALAVAGTAVDLTDGGAGAHNLTHGSKAAFAAVITNAVPGGSKGDALTGDLTMKVAGAVTLT